MSSYFHGIKKTWREESFCNSWENEIQLDDKIYFSQCDYSLDYTVDEGDDLTPPTTTIRDIDIKNLQIYAYNEETGEFDIDITELNNPTLFKALSLKTEEEIVEYEYERL